MEMNLVIAVWTRERTSKEFRVEIDHVGAGLKPALLWLVRSFVESFPGQPKIAKIAKRGEG